MVNCFKSVFNKEKKLSNEQSSPNNSSVKGIKRATIVHRILLNRWFRVLLILLLMSIALPILIYIFTENLEDTSMEGTCDVNPDYRSPCLMGNKKNSMEICENVGCCWDAKDKQCYHRISSVYGYLIKNWNQTEPSHWNSLPTVELFCKNPLSPYQTPTFQDLKFLLNNIDKSHLHIQIGTPKTVQNRKNSFSIANSDFNVTYFGPYFSFEISRNGDKSYFLSSSMGPFIASKNFWEITLHTPAEFVAYGLGGSRIQKGTRVLFNREKEMNTLPFLIYLDKTGRAHGLFIQTPGPMEFQYSQSSNLLILRSLSDPNLWNFHLFAGPTPSLVMDQFTNFIGKPKLPDFWTLGLHICRDFNGDMEEAIKDFNNFKKYAKIYDSYCIDDNLLGQLTMSLNLSYLEQLQEIAKELNTNSRKLIITLPLQVNLDSDMYKDYKNNYLTRPNNHDIYIGEYKSKKVVYPDLKSPDLPSMLENKLKELNQLLPFDGIYLTDNWPDNDVDVSGEIMPFVYVPEELSGTLSISTIHWNISHGNDKHYNLHNLYANLHIETLSAMNFKGILISNSGYPGIGRLAGLAAGRKHSFPVSEFFYAMLDGLDAVVGSGLAGIAFTGGSPVCGTVPDLTTDIIIECARWYRLAALTAPLLRVSSPKPFRDPGASSFINQIQERMIVDQSILLRYSLLTYFYGNMATASLTGVPLVKPLFFEFSSDPYAIAISNQVLIGDTLMLAPAIAPEQTSREVYLPEGYWYFWPTGILQGIGPLKISVKYYVNEVILLMRGGFIIPVQNVGNSAEDTRWQPISLVAALDCINYCQADGKIYQKYDNEEVWLNISTSESMLVISNLKALCQMKKHIDTITSIQIFGLALNRIPEKIILTPKPTKELTYTIEYNTDTNVLKILQIDCNWCELNSDTLQVEWK